MDMLSKHFESIIADTRIYCLVPEPDSILMWTHYADSHKGICLEFAVDNPVFQQAAPIKYKRNYPVWAPGIHDDLGDFLLTKAEDWSYEKEYRIFASNDDAMPNGEPNHCKLIGEHVRLPPQALTGIILGCQCDAKAENEIRDIVHKHSPGLPIRRAVRLPFEYKLCIES